MEDRLDTLHEVALVDKNVVREFRLTMQSTYLDLRKLDSFSDS